MGAQAENRRWTFLVWCVVSFVLWNWAVFELAARGLIGSNTTGIALLLWPVAVAVCSLPFARAARRRVDERHRRELAGLQKQRQEANLRLLVLQAQLEPHFLFNTLASLRAALREDVAQAESLVDALVRHLRAVLPVMRSDAGTSTLADQLAICDSYLQLMAIRLDGRLAYSVDVPDSLLDAGIPPLMLITLVENAVKHGIEPKIGGGLVRIEAECVTRPSGRSLLVRVLDDGVGLPTGPGGGLGLRNIREQLALNYGEHAALSICGRTEGGTIASILLPLAGGRAS